MHFKKFKSRRFTYSRMRLNILLISILSCLFFLSVPLPALDPNQPIDSYLVEDWSTDSSMNQLTVANMVQTPDGYLWVQFYGQASFRYDGNKFTWVRDIAKLPTDIDQVNSTLLIDLDNEGRLWMLVNKGLVVYQENRIQFVDHLKEFPRSDFAAGVHDSYGNIWLGTMGGTLYCRRNNELIKYDEDRGFKVKGFSHFIEDSRRRLWAISRKNGLYRLDGEKFVTEKLQALPDDAILTSMKEDRKGHFWIGTSRGLIRKNSNTSTLFTTKDGLSDNFINDILIDSSDNIWLATDRGLNRIKETPQGKLTINHRFENYIITTLLEDHERYLWFGTEGMGLMRLRDRVCRLVNIQSQRQNFTTTIFYDDYNYIWAGDIYGDVVKINSASKKIEKRYNFPGHISAISKDRGGNIWVGTEYEGLFQIKPNGNTTQYTNQLLHREIKSLMSDSQNRIWIGTRNGLNIYQNGKFKAWNNLDGFTNYNIFGFTEDSDGNVWVSSYRGLFRFEKGIVSAETLTSLLKNYSNSCLYQDREGVSWIGGNSEGIIRYKNGELFHYKDAVRGAGMRNEINKIVEDDFGYLWISSPNRILRVSREQLNHYVENDQTVVTPRLFGKRDGLLSTESYGHTTNTAVKTNSGELWFATKNGIAIFNPAAIKIRKHSPFVHIEKVTVDSKPVDPIQKTGVLETESPSSVKLYFTSPQFDLRKQVFFRYKLEGYDKEWRRVEPGESRNAEYRGLPPGDYRFFVTGCNSDGVWSQKGAEFKFTIPFHFFKSNLFAMLLLFFVFLGFGILIFFREKVKLEKKYAPSGLDKTKVDQCLTRLNQLMEKEKVYQDDSITLDTLAKQLDIPPWYLSRVINQELNKSFFDLINYYRIEDVKNQLLDENSSHSILDIAFDVGFNTKSAFNRAFKKFTNMTPSQYKKMFAKNKSNESR